MINTGVADILPDRIRRLVYWNAFVPNDGESVTDMVPKDYVTLFDAIARQRAWPPAADFLAAEERRGKSGCRRTDPESQFTKQQLAAILQPLSRSRECKPGECKRSGQTIYARGGLRGIGQARCGGRPRPAIRCGVPISDGPGRRPCWLSPSQLPTPRLVNPPSNSVRRSEGNMTRPMRQSCDMRRNRRGQDIHEHCAGRSVIHTDHRHACGENNILHM
jgi:hypothetical protein